MSISVAIYLDDSEHPQAELNAVNPDNVFAVVELSSHPARAYVALRTMAEADALVTAATEARDLLAAAQGGTS